jgi:dipeptidyl aminopeptidase/acylaminoacyl peptidase
MCKNEAKIQKKNDSIDFFCIFAKKPISNHQNQTNMILQFKRLLLAAAVMLSIATVAQDMSYCVPPKEIADLILAKPSPTVNINRQGTLMLLQEREPMISVEELAQPEIGLAGFRVNPRTFGNSRETYIANLRFKDLTTLKEHDIEGLPANAKINNISWSPESKYIVFFNTTNTGIELWRINVAERKAAKLSNRRVNDVLGGRGVSYSFISEEQILFTAVPDNIGAMPERKPAPTGVVAQNSKGVAAPAMTFQDLLKNPYDEELFDYFATSQPVIWSPEGEKLIGKPAVYGSLSPSPDKAYILVQTVQRPYSYQVPVSRFATNIEVWNMNGIAVKTLATNPLEETLPIGHDVTSTKPRNFSWRNDVPATVVWVEALDNGDGVSRVPHRDAVFTLSAPFNGEKQLFLKTEFRFRNITWGNDKLALYSDGMTATRRIRTFRFDPSNLNSSAELLFDRSTNDAYADQGTPHTIRNNFGRLVLYTGKNNNELLFTGNGASPEGDMPFLNRFDLRTKRTTTLWRCKAPYFESVVNIINPERGTFITSRQSTEEPINFFFHDLNRKRVTQLTEFPHPYPQLLGVQKQQVKYKRKDGIDLTATVYTPKGYDPQRDGRLPVLMWAYPREYTSAADAGQVRGSRYMFTRIGNGSPVLYVTQGFVIMDATEMPIVGVDGKEPNDGFVEQLIMNAEAAIDQIVGMGIGDRDRIAVGGHSYGAFMTANLLAHTNLFKAGIARSGAYNRTLTPFGFQGERRTFWQAPEVYNVMSPFMYADKIKTPILLIHGDSDNNTGTFPVQSERFFAALRGNGATTRLVMLPFESHGYVAKENVLHALYETDAWLKEYVGSKE